MRITNSVPRAVASVVFMTFLWSPRSVADSTVPVVVIAIGGGGYGQPVALNGVWDFDDLSANQRAAALNCENTMFASPGENPSMMGWVPSPQSNVLPHLDMASEWLDTPSEDVQGWSLVGYDTGSGGFIPMHWSVAESPPFLIEGLAPPSAQWEVAFTTNANRDFEPTQLCLVVGSRYAIGGIWTPWVDQILPILGGPHENRVPLAISAEAEQGQVRVGTKNQNGTPTPDPGPAVDKVKVEAKAPATISTWKYVPDISQGEDPICQASAFANCLSYWANNGYSELAPAQGTQEEKNKKIQEDLKKEVHDNDKGDAGVTKYMKDKGVMKGQQQPNGRRPLEHVRMSSKVALWDSLLANFQKCHDVLLRITWCDANGNPVSADAAHYLTVAGITVDENGNKKIHVANPWGDSHHSPTEDTRDDAYDELDVTIGQDGKVRLDNDDIENNADGITGADHLCLTHINIIRPAAAGQAPRDVALTETHRDRSLVEYAYGVSNDTAFPMNEWAMHLDVPYQDVESPPGWSWTPLPALHQDAVGCGDELRPAGILWTTSTVPVPPGGFLSGFKFKTDSQYPTEDFGVIWWTDTTGGLGEFGPVVGPVPLLSAAAGPLSARLPGISLRGYPNPAAGPVRLHLANEAAGPVRVEIFDVGGRLVRTLIAQEVPSGAHELIWDRRDDEGRRLAAGAYEVRARSGGLESRSRIVLLN